MNKVLAGLLQSKLENWQSLNLSPGTNLTIEDTENGVFNLASGYYDNNKEKVMPVNGRFYIYSITKTFTAIKILQLAEQAAIK